MYTLMHRIDLEGNLNRWYLVTIQESLLDSVAVVCQYGSLITTYQQTRVLPAASMAEANQMAKSIVDHKLGRGYWVVEKSPK